MRLKHLRKTKLGAVPILGIVFLLVIIVSSIIVPVLTSNPLEYSTEFFGHPSGTHWLGTNDVGQDIFSRLFYGARSSLIVAIGVSLCSTVISILLGASAGILGGFYDRIVMRLVDILLIIPTMLWAILFAVYIFPGDTGLIILFSLLTWPVGARIIRAQTMILKGKLYVQAARTFGAELGYLIRHHIIPDMAPVVIANIVQVARRAVFMEAALAFIGVSDPLRISWGMELHHALKFVHLGVWLWWLLPVGILLAVTILAFTFIGYFLEEIVDPQLREEKHA